MILVGLPAYNEEGRIKNLLMDIHKSLKGENCDYKVIVYNDGSSDNTASEVLSASKEGISAHLVDVKENKGLGHAVSYLINFCTDAASREDTIIIMDADATHNPEHIHRMLSYIKDGFDLVIASRYTSYSRIKGLALHRRILSLWASLIFKTLFPITGVFDYTCAYRAYTSKILKLAKEVYGEHLIEETGFSCMAELLIKLKKLGLIACEVPLILRYDRKAGPTKMKILATAFRTLKLILKSFFLKVPQGKELEALRKKYHI